jgi:thioester reductase-like protein
MNLPIARGDLLVTGGLGYLGSHIIVELLRTSDKKGF